MPHQACCWEKVTSLTPYLLNSGWTKEYSIVVESWLQHVKEMM